MIQPFPVTDDARCVLCHQELSPEAQKRLLDFEKYVQGELEGDAQTAEKAYSTALTALPPIPTLDQITTQCEAAGLGTDDWPRFLSSFWNSASAIRSALLEGEATGEAAAIQDVSEAVENLNAYITELEVTALQLDEDARAFDRAQATQTKTSLEARKWISEQADAVRNEISRLKHVQQLETLKSLANSRPVTTKAGAISEQVITQAYLNRFNDELKSLGALRIQVEIVKTRAEKARVFHKIQLKSAKTKESPETVLSEGERRIISLAAFLADVSEKPSAAPFVFDDPISSLDHDFEWYVARRLTELAQSRQVLIFTHRLSLYGAIEEAAKKAGDDWRKQHLQQLCIEAYAGTSGHPADQATWNANTKKANNILLERLTTAKRAGDQSGAEAYRQLAQGICSDFRKLIERTVEDDLLNQVVKRHRRSITTENRLEALQFIEKDDCQFLDELMTKYSCYEHSQSHEAPVFIPEEQELRADLESLSQWRANLPNRRKS